MGRRDRRRKKRGEAPPAEAGAPLASGSGADAPIAEEREGDARMTAPLPGEDGAGRSWYKPKRGRIVRWSSFGVYAFFVVYGLFNLHVHLTAVGDPGVNPDHWLNAYTREVVAIPLPVVDDQIVITAGLLVSIGLGAVAGWYLLRLVWRNPRVSEFLIDTQTELQKVSWPSLPELKSSTVAVVIAVAILSTYLLLVDMALAAVFSTIIGTGA